MSSPIMSVGDLTARQAAAIMLQVPASGDEWLDQMIDEASRRQLQGFAMMALMVHNSLMELANAARGSDAGSPWSEHDIAAYAGVQAGAMLDGQMRLEF